MDILILITILVFIGAIVYSTRKQTKETREKMIEELNLLEELDSPIDSEWEDQEADVYTTPPIQSVSVSTLSTEPTPVVSALKPKPKKGKGRPKKK